MSIPLAPPGGSTDWDEDCMKWRGEKLTGFYAHWCPEWDFLPVDETCRNEWPCACKDVIARVRERRLYVLAMVLLGLMPFLAIAGLIGIWASPLLALYGLAWIGAVALSAFLACGVALIFVVELRGRRVKKVMGEANERLTNAQPY